MKTQHENLKVPGFVSKDKINESDLYLNTNIDSLKRSQGFKQINRLTKLDMSITSKWQSSSESETPAAQGRKLSSHRKKEDEK